MEVAKCAVFAVFGTLLTLHGLFEDGWAAVGVVAVVFLVARPIAVFTALAGTGLGTDIKAFMAWFGPKGVATLTLAILLLGEAIPGNERIFHLAALAVVASLLVFGATDRAGVNWIARRAARPAPGRSGTPTSPSSAAPGET